MLHEKCKRIASTFVLGAFVLGMPATAFANPNQPDFVNQSDFAIEDEILVKQDNADGGKGAYQKITEESLWNAKYSDSMAAVFDDDSGLYKIESKGNMYLVPVSDGIFQSVEKSVIVDTGDLRTVSEEFALTAKESEDIASFMSQCPGNQIDVYAPRAEEYEGEYNGKKCRLVQITAADNASRFQIGKGLNPGSLGYNTVVYAISTLGAKVNIGTMIANAVLNLVGINFTFKSDSSSYAAKNERATFQYMDFYELGSAYITRGISSYGTIFLTTNTACWVKQPNGDYVNESIVGKPVSGSFGRANTLQSLAAKSWPYFEDYSGMGEPWYTDYTTKFQIDRFNSIPAISPKR